MRTTALALVLAAAAAAGPSFARQDPQAVRSAVESFLRAQTRQLPGDVTVTVRDIDPHNGLAPCPALEAFLPEGARAWGRTAVGVRCQAQPGWSLFVPVQVRIETDYIVAARPLAAGAVIGPRDLATRRGDLAELPANALTDPSQAMGRRLQVGLAAGRPLSADQLRAPNAIVQGQSIRVLARGAGFDVSTEGRALNAAAAGQLTQVRTAGGRTLSGLARADGAVEIRF
ncbi:MAG: hypothetical protein OHK0026_03870 [Rhodocyclaceae bacterium]